MSKEPGTVLKRGPSGAISDGVYNTEIQDALHRYFKSHGINIKDPIMIELLTNIMKYTREEETSTSEKDADGYYMGLQKIKDDILKAHSNCKLVTGLKRILLSDDKNHYGELQNLESAYKELEHKIKENNNDIKKLQSRTNKLQKKLQKKIPEGLKQAIADNTELEQKALEEKTGREQALEGVMVQMKSLLQAIENQIKQLEKFIYLMLIITIIYDKSVLHLLVAGPLFSYKDGNTHSTKIREGIGKNHGLLGRCNQKLLDLESTLQVVDAIYQLREIIDSGNGITNKQIDAFVSGINKRGAPPEVTRDIETLKQVIRLCTIRGNFVNFDPFSQEVKQGSLKKKRTHRKKTQHKKTPRKKTNRKKTQRKKTNRKKTQHKKTQRKKTNRKKSKKSVKTGGSGLSDDNVANIIIGVFVVLLFAGTPVLLAMLEAFVITILVNLVVFLINGFRSICCGGEEEDSQRSRGRRGSHEIQETSSGRQRRIIKDQKRNSQPLHPSLIISAKKLIEKHNVMEAARRAEAEAAKIDPSFMLEPTVSGQRYLDLS